jgi:hypothetical protein
MGHRLGSLRLYMTALWSMCFEGRHAMPSQNPTAILEVAELQQRLVIKLLFDSTEHTLHTMMAAMWPNGTNPHAALKELSRHADFIRIHQFPESQQVEITGFFLPSAPVIQFPTELRGWWIEPLMKKYVKTSEDEIFLKRIPLQQPSTLNIGENLDHASDTLRTTLLQMANVTHEDRIDFEKRLNNIKFLVQEIDKKMVKKKTA